QTYVHDRTWLPSVFRGRILLKVEFLDGINRQNGRGIAGDSRTIDNRLAGIRFAVEQAFDEIRVILRAQAVGTRRRKSTAGVAHYAGAQLQKVLVIAAAQGKIVDLFVTERAAQGGGRG